jgi:DNA-binding SARP family transcriptional activator
LSSRQTRLPYLLVDTQTVQFNYQSDYWLDVQAFGDQLAKVEDHGHLELDACSYLSPVVKAGELYRGEFLANFHPTGSRSLDEWLLGWREHLQRQASIIFQALAEFHFFHGELEQAQCYAQRVLHLDPWNEATHRLLLRVLLLSQGRGAAVQYHHDFREALCTELGIEPEHETLALVNHIRRHGKV